MDTRSPWPSTTPTVPDQGKALWTIRYLWSAAADHLLADEPLDAAPGEAEDVLWALADHLGTVRDLSRYNAPAGTTTILNHRTFDSFGNLQRAWQTADCPHPTPPTTHPCGLASGVHAGPPAAFPG